MIRILLLALVLVVFGSSVLSAQLPIRYQERVELAKKLIAEDRKSAIANPTDLARSYCFTRTNSLIDPAWTAEFILSNRIKDSQDIAYENRTIRNLIGHADALSPGQIKQLIGYYPFMSHQYRRYVLKKIGDDPAQENLRSELHKDMCDELENLSGISLALEFGNSLSLLQKLNKPELADRLKEKIDDFYRNGEAEKVWHSIKKVRGANRYHRALMIRNAPDGFNLGFLGKVDSTTVDAFQVAQVINDQFGSEEVKLAWLSEKKVYDFGANPNGADFSATILGEVARYDLDKALAWADSADREILTIIARLSIAPVLAKRNKPSAIQLVKDCYDACLRIDPTLPENRGNMTLQVIPPVRVAVAGLQIANHLDDRLLNECVTKTLKLVEEKLKPIRGQVDNAEVFRSLAGIARYDLDRSKEVFDRISEEVALLDADSYFIALTAIDPKSVWDEYQSLPSERRDEHEHRLRIRVAIAPALAQRDEDVFWADLLGYWFIRFPSLTVDDQ